MRMGEDGGGPSPDRADALVWAVTELLLGRRRRGAPTVRRM
jgi:phage terminase large subunit-like protein